MLLRLLLLFTVVPLVELMLLLVLADKTSWQFTLAVVLTTGVVGAALARHQGLRCWRRVHETMAAGQLPGDPLMDGLMILLAGALLVTPGMLTDLVGFALLLPIFRRLVKRWLKRRFEASIRVTSSIPGWPPADRRPADHDEIIDSRVIDVPPERPEQP
ncbi:MAG: FxsA family protein [Pirellulales bacterium]|nr:FxsA family protein [Pirellulales bacterium]